MSERSKPDETKCAGGFNNIMCKVGHCTYCFAGSLDDYLNLLKNNRDGKLRCEDTKCKLRNCIFCTARIFST